VANLVTIKNKDPLVPTLTLTP